MDNNKQLKSMDLDGTIYDDGYPEEWLEQEQREEKYKKSIQELREQLRNVKTCDKCGMDAEKLLGYVDAFESIGKTCVLL